ncbi:MAG: hypothetical protein HKO68_20235, partial [Desulfobacterales bacterium]|nr:hypothetical protein [Desulfobacterales bacterium]
MKLKKEYIILALIIIALSVYLVTRSTNRTFYQLPEMPRVTQKEITRLQIIKAGAALEITKKDNTWYIAPEEYPADADKIKDMLGTIADLT